jgi:hypothetical protein
MQNVKVICTNRGGQECTDCVHGKPHNVILHNHERAEAIEVHKNYCSCAVDGGAGATVSCFPVS